MAPLSSLLTLTAVASAAAFSPASTLPTASTRPSTRVYENFGFDFAEDQVENTPQIILGEANYKKWVNTVDPDNMLNRQVSLEKKTCLVAGRRGRELELEEAERGLCECCFPPRVRGRRGVSRRDSGL